MAKKKKTDPVKETGDREVTVKEFIDTTDFFGPDDTIFLRQYGSGVDEKYKVSDIPRRITNRILITVQAHFGGVEYGYSAYRLIYRKG